MAKRVKLIFNPIANLGRAWARVAELRPLVDELGGADWAGTVYPTHGIELARQAAEEGYDLVVAIGGDGTAHEVVNGLMQTPAERRPALGVVPMGSGNDFSHALGISHQPLEALRQVFTGTPAPIDLGKVTDGHGRSQYFTNAVGIGIDTKVTLRTRKIRFLQGTPLFLVATLQTIFFDEVRFAIQIETDQEAWDEVSDAVILMNGSREGGGFWVAPKGKPDDGLLNYLTVRHISRLVLLQTLPEILKGTQEGRFNVRMGQFKKLRLSADRSLFVHYDGEIVSDNRSDTRELSIEIVPGALMAVR